MHTSHVSASRIEVTAVARITITRQWPDHDVLSVTVKAESSYPDALAEAVRTAVHTFAEALDVAVTEADES